MDSAGPVYTQKIITMERGVRDRYVDDGHTSAKNLGLEYEAEKRDLQKLNNSFSLYLARVKQMEMANKSLEDELKNLRDRWGFGTAEIRDQKDKELEDLRITINNVEAAKDLPQIKTRSAEYSADILKGKLNFLNELAEGSKQRFKKLEHQKIIFNDELNEWVKRNNGLEDDLAKLRNMLQENLKQLEGHKNELDFVTMERMDLENKVQTLRDQIAFLQSVQEAELNELQDLCKIDFDTGTFYKRELTKAIDDIRRDFNTLSDAQKDHTMQYYESRIEEVRNQVIAEEKEIEEAKSSGQVEVMNLGSLKESIHNMKREKGDLENEHNGLRAVLREVEQKLYDLQAIKHQRQTQQENVLAQLNEELRILQEKLRNASEGNVSLRFEINTYRRLLEMQEKQLNDVASDMVGTGSLGTYGQSAGGFTSSQVYDSSSTRGVGANVGVSSGYSSGLGGSTFGAAGASAGGGTGAVSSGYSSQSAYGQGFSSGGSTSGSMGTRSGAGRGGMNAASQNASPNTYLSGISDPSVYLQSDITHADGYTGMDSGNKGVADFSGSLSNYHRICSLRQIDGNISIEDIGLNDRYVSLKNTSTEEVDIGGYEIEQRDDYSTIITYKIPPHVTIRPQAILRIFSKAAARYASPDDIVGDSVTSWLNTPQVTTLLFKPNGEKTAELIMKPLYP